HSYTWPLPSSARSRPTGAIASSSPGSWAADTMPTTSAPLAGMSCSHSRAMWPGRSRMCQTGRKSSSTSSIGRPERLTSREPRSQALGGNAGLAALRPEPYSTQKRLAQSKSATRSVGTCVPTQSVGTRSQSMFTLSAFADEIDPDPQKQIDVLKSCGVRHIEFRSILKTNVLDLTDLQVAELKSLLARHGFQLSAIGSPIGKIRINEPFAPHLTRFQRAIELCKVFDTPNIRLFSYYLPENDVWDNWRRDVLDRMWDKIKLAEKARVRLVHENEHRIYGDEPERVKDLMETVLEQVDLRYFGSVYDPANYVHVRLYP